MCVCVCVYVRVCACVCVCVCVCVQVKCLTLFVTHYPLIGDLQKCFPSAVANYHMAYLQVEDSSQS